MMRNLGWKSLEFHRKIDSVVTFHDIRTGKIAIPEILPKHVREGVKYQPIHGRVLAYSQSFVPLTTNWWNDLPKDTLCTDNRNDFKIAISKHFENN